MERALKLFKLKDLSQSFTLNSTIRLLLDNNNNSCIIQYEDNIKVQLQSTQELLYPVLDYNRHWFLIGIKYDDKIKQYNGTYYNSSLNIERIILPIIYSFFKKKLKCITKFIEFGKSTYTDTTPGYSKINRPWIQKNNFDCSVNVICFIYCLYMNLEFIWDQEMIYKFKFRKRIVNDIKNNNLNEITLAFDLIQKNLNNKKTDNNESKLRSGKKIDQNIDKLVHY
jgi:hypothetical protein